MIPLLHDFAGTTVLVVGGGRVGARKARRFAREARVVVVSPEFADADFGGAELVRAELAPETAADWLERVDPSLVVAATDDGDLNAAVCEAAREAGALRNRTDAHGERDPGSVVVPATARDGDVTVAVATGGKSPALSRRLRRRFEDELEGAGAMADLTADLRERLQREGVAPAERRAAVRAVVQSSRVWKGLRTGTPNPRREAEVVLADALADDT
ncbi:MAG: bifunctional precorrin-2 dehydrogenase/sirohydrochlorin ferrochelatase [Halobacteriaceae archaeon]